MLLTCPSCTASYNIDGASLGEAGRKVRCAACKTIWYAKKTDDEPIALSETEMVAEAVAPTPKAPETIAQIKAKELPKLYRFRLEDQKRVKELATQGIIWGAMSACLIGAFVMAYVFRVDIVSNFPSTANAYAMVGTHVNATGLEAGVVKALPGFKGGRFVVHISAEYKNIRDKPTIVPPIRASIKDRNGVLISTTLIPSNGMMIDAGAKRNITFDVPDAKNLTSDIDLRFDLVALKKEKTYGALYRQAAKRQSQIQSEHAQDQYVTPISKTLSPAPLEPAQLKSSDHPASLSEASPLYEGATPPALRPAHDANANDTGHLPETAHSKPAH